MAVKATWSRILVDQFGLSGSSNQLVINIDTAAIEYNVFQDPAKQSISGDPTATIDHSGYFTTNATGQLEDTIYDRLATSCQVAAILGSDQVIWVAYVIPDAFASLLNIDSPANELITIKAKWTVLTGKLYRGYGLWTGNITATGVKDTVDFGSAGVDGGLAWLFVHSHVGTITNAAITIQSDDNSGFTSSTARNTFVFSADGAYAIDIPIVERYLRINAGNMGGATSFNVTVIAGVAGVTY